MKMAPIIILFTVIGCVKTQPHPSKDVTLPPNISIPEPMVGIIKDVTDKSPDAYFPSESKSTNMAIYTPEAAYRQITILYPQRTKMVECWTELNNHFIFSLGKNAKIKNAYLHILYIRKGGRKFGYYWPHT
jgi:hypothetical protein